MSRSDFALDKFAMTPELGFLGPSGIAETVLPAGFDPVLQLAAALSDLLTSDVLRRSLAQMPDPVTDAFLNTASDAQLRAAMVRYTFMAQAYVWGRIDAAPALPASLARPVWKLAERLGTKPLLIYANYVLDNWALIDADRPIELGNIRMVQKFLGGRDEAWFVLVHVAIEAKAGGVLALFPDILKAASEKDSGSLEMLFSAMIVLWDDINAIFDRMPESCDPYIYFNRVRSLYPRLERQSGFAKRHHL